MGDKVCSLAREEKGEEADGTKRKRRRRRATQGLDGGQEGWMVVATSEESGKNGQQVRVNTPYHLVGAFALAQSAHSTACTAQRCQWLPCADAMLQPGK